MTGFPLPRPNGTGVALNYINISNIIKHPVEVCLLCHFLLLLLPLASLQVEQSVDLLFFCLCIIEFEDVVVDGLP